MLYQIFLSPQVKRWEIIGYKHGMYDFHHKFQLNLYGNILPFRRRMWRGTPQWRVRKMSPP